MTVEDLDKLIKETSSDAFGDDEQIRSFHRAFENGVDLPCGMRDAKSGLQLADLRGEKLRGEGGGRK